jgi:hypothetical protein
MDGAPRGEAVDGVAVQFLDRGLCLFALDEPTGMDAALSRAATAPETRGRADLQSGLRLAADLPDRLTTVEVGTQDGKRFADRAGFAEVTLAGDGPTLDSVTAFAGELDDDVFDPATATNPLDGPEPSVGAVDLAAATPAVDGVPEGFRAAPETLPDDDGRLFGNPGLADAPAARADAERALGADVARLHLRDDADVTAGNARHLLVREADEAPVVVVAGAGAGVAATVEAVAANPSAPALDDPADAGVVWVPFDGAAETPAVVDERVDPGSLSPDRLAAACDRAAGDRLVDRLDADGPAGETLDGGRDR